MANPHPMGANPYLVTAADNGGILEVGNGGNGSSGGWAIQFTPDLLFDGGFAVEGRADGTAFDGIPFLPIPYRVLNLNGTVDASGGALTTALLNITGPTLIQVPSSGVFVALLASVNAGTCQIARVGFNGSGAP